MRGRRPVGPPRPAPVAATAPLPDVDEQGERSRRRPRDEPEDEPRPLGPTPIKQRRARSPVQGAGKFKRAIVPFTAREEVEVKRTVVPVHAPTTKNGGGETPVLPPPHLRGKGQPVVEVDRADPLAYAKYYGVTRDQLMVLDRLVASERFKPRVPATTGRIDHVFRRLIVECHLTTRGLAMHLYKSGMQSIWVKGSGLPFFGTQNSYLEYARSRTVQAAIATLPDEQPAWVNEK